MTFPTADDPDEDINIEVDIPNPDNVLYESLSDDGLYVLMNKKNVLVESVTEVLDDTV